MEFERVKRDEVVRFSSVLPRIAPKPADEREVEKQLSRLNESPDVEEMQVDKPSETMSIHRVESTTFGAGLLSTGPTSLFEVDLAIQKVTDEIKRLQQVALVDTEGPVLKLKDELQTLKEARLFNNLPQVEKLGAPVIERAPACATAADFEQRQEGKAKLLAEAKKILQDRNNELFSGLVSATIAKQSLAGIRIAKPVVQSCLYPSLMDDAIKDIIKEYRFA